MNLNKKMHFFGALLCLFVFGWLYNHGQLNIAAIQAQTNVVQVTVNNNDEHQVMEGFGADQNPTDIDNLNLDGKKKLFDFAFGSKSETDPNLFPKGGMNLNVVRMNPHPNEGANSGQLLFGQNDNADPDITDRSKFNYCQKSQWTSKPNCFDRWMTPQSGLTDSSWAQGLWQYMKDKGVTGEYLGLIQGPCWNNMRYNDKCDYTNAPNGFSVAEMVENQFEFIKYAKDHGMDLKLVTPFSEPDGGGIGWPVPSPELARDVVKALGDKLRAAGYNDIYFQVSDATNFANALEWNRIILQDPDARKYVKAIGYHVYNEGGQNFAARDNNGSGPLPEDSWIRARNQMRDLGRQYNIGVRMSEWANERNFANRMNHMFNEIEYADSQTYFPQFIATVNAGEEGEANIVRFTSSSGSFGNITSVGPSNPTGMVIGQYSRFVLPGNVRLGTANTDASGQIKVQAFRDDVRNKISFIVINNSSENRPVQIALNGISINRGAGAVTGERTRDGASTYWDATPSVTPTVLANGQHAFTPTVAPFSISSFIVDMTGDDGGGNGDKANVAVTKSASAVTPDKKITYTLTAANTSTKTATNVKVTDVIPSGTTYVANSANNNGSRVGNAIVWNIGNIPASGQVGASKTLTFQVQAN